MNDPDQENLVAATEKTVSPDGTQQLPGANTSQLGGIRALPQPPGADTPLGVTQAQRQSWLKSVLQYFHKRSLWIAGVLLVFIVGFINNCIFGWNIDIFNEGSLKTMLRLGVLLSVFVGVVLIRSWWAFLIVPVSSLAGAVLASVLVPLIQGAWPRVKSAALSVPIGLLTLVLTIVFIILGGTLLGFALRRKEP